ncbi:hypothetical protein [Legionella tunisiensis]|uniref:hypothetical protein n=1 Tax=Legionella tunisiensis TaxID=1034944 RepID=UPI0002D64071|nr:hypothetical protein [Legionella tunisiensis]
MLPVQVITDLLKDDSLGALFPLVKTAKVERKQERTSQAQGGTSYHYMNEAEQKEALLQVDSKGLYRNKDGQPVTGTFLFVVLENGDIIHAPETTAEGPRYRHSALANGKKVRAAGMLYLKNGQLMAISNESGHYKPAGEKLYEILQVFISESKNPQLIFEDHTQAAFGFVYQYAAQNFINNERNILKTIPVNQRTMVEVDEDIYETYYTQSSRFGLKPKIIPAQFFLSQNNK